MFEISWVLTDGEWERAEARREDRPPNSAYDISRSALYQLLYGDFEIRTGIGELYGAGGINTSLFDSACFAARILEEDCVSKVSFDQLDDDRHIRFDFSTPSVRISADDSETILEAPRNEVIRGLRQFLVSLAHGLDRRAPRVFDWRSMGPLVGYRSA